MTRAPLGLRASRAAAISSVSLLAILAFSSSAGAEEPGQGREIAVPGAVLKQRQRPAVVNAALEDRLENLLPGLMRAAGLDMWLVINREYAEDPVYFSLVPKPVHAARRTTMLVFFDRGVEEGLERLTVNRYPVGSLYESAWQGGDLGEQWSGLAGVIRDRDPKRIGINVSRDWPVADGLTAGLEARLLETLPAKYVERLRPAEELVIRWLETRTPMEVDVYPHIVALARAVISEAFSELVITPGLTTTDDVAWYIAQRFSDLGLPIWFQPYVNLQRADLRCEPDDSFCGISGVIRRGDVLHTDVGICYLGLCSDTQEMGYVLRLGEGEIPGGLVAALETGNRWQDLLTSQFRTGRTGNEILAATQAAAAAEGIASSTYSHPLGLFGHAPGPTIGMWDNQGPTLVRGEWPLHPSTAYAIEGNVKVAVAEWDGALVQVKLEQSALFDGDRILYLAGRQTRWHLVH